MPGKSDSLIHLEQVQKTVEALRARIKEQDAYIASLQDAIAKHCNICTSEDREIVAGSVKKIQTNLINK